jgi:hypothetical protein
MIVSTGSADADCVISMACVNPLSISGCHHAMLVHAILGIRASPAVCGRADSQDPIDHDKT